MRYVLMVFLLITTSAFPQDTGDARIGTVSFSTTREGHTASVTFTVDRFTPALHKITDNDWKAVDDPYIERIDGRIPLGIDGNMPSYEIKSMRLDFDGKKAEIPKELYSDCYNPPFPRYNKEIQSNYFKIKIGDDMKSVFVFMAGGDAAGSYRVVWILRPDGAHSRFSQACPDCSFIDFSGFVSD